MATNNRKRTGVNPDEIERIRKEYKRRACEVPKGLYSPDQPGQRFIYAQRRSAVLEALKREGFFPLQGKEILDVGCGTGVWWSYFETWGAEQQRLHGIDLNRARVERAIQRYRKADIREGESSQLPWPDQIFDVVLQATMFTSVLDPMLKQAIAREMMRVVKSSGIILWYDFRYDNPNNPNVRGIGAKEIASLFPGYEVKLQKITLMPMISRWLAPKSLLACRFLTSIPFLNTHYLGVLRYR